MTADQQTLASNGAPAGTIVKSPESYEKILQESQNFKLIKELHDAYSKGNPLPDHTSDEIKPNLTGYTLFGEDKINFRSPSLYFINQKYWNFEDISGEEPVHDNYSITFFHLGTQLSGHPNIVHGGLLATLLDELTCRLAFQNFYSKRGVTANLNINYKQPTFVDQYVMIKCTLVKKQGRKCWVNGAVYKFNLEDHEEEVASTKNLLTECTVLVIEPKWVDDLKH